MRVPSLLSVGFCGVLLGSGCSTAAAPPSPALDSAVVDASPPTDVPSGDDVGGGALGEVQTPIGQPPWRLRCAQSSYPAPTDPAGYRRATGVFLASALAPEHSTRAPNYGVHAGTAHAPPYDDEPRRFLTRGRATPRAEFTRDELDAQGSHIALCVLVPDDAAPRGVTDDGADLPMIPASRFPLRIEYDYTAGPDAIGPLRETYPYPGVAAEGVSHVTLRWTQQFAFEPDDVFPLAMSFRLTLRDAMGEGYQVTLPFRATDPGS